MTINVINLPHRADRMEVFRRAMAAENCSFKTWPGVNGRIPKQNISKAHKQIVQWAKDEGFPEVCIAEDDMVWTAPGAWNFFTWNKPEEFDVYLSSHYGAIQNSDKTLKHFSGLTLYVVSSRFYDRFLAIPENIHLDTGIGLSGALIKVCPEFCAIQSPGYSDNVKNTVNYEKKLKNQKLFGH